MLRDSPTGVLNPEHRSQSLVSAPASEDSGREQNTEFDGFGAIPIRSLEPIFDSLRDPDHALAEDIMLVFPNCHGLEPGTVLKTALATPQSQVQQRQQLQNPSYIGYRPGSRNTKSHRDYTETKIGQTTPDQSPTSLPALLPALPSIVEVGHTSARASTNDAFIDRSSDRVPEPKLQAGSLQQRSMES
ncbi:hypothetical protein NM208_g15673 [Fusarium decemcellulare]|uniref:Uncharacterized protein n=1 Tax=Fusarium decemcellulare TaxID=57161 RepID=A0ACC1RCG5_9HYPO|nr:hypothetical protein NM208_g15673 [Fusarium decemcellulare]